MADRKDAITTNITPLLCHRIINVNPIQLNKADAEQILAVYTPYLSEVMNNNTTPTNRTTVFVVRVNLKYALRISFLVLSVISNKNA